MIDTELLALLSKKSKKTEKYILDLCEEIGLKLVSQGIKVDEVRFKPYLLINLRKELNITEKLHSIKTFKSFLKKMRKEE